MHSHRTLIFTPASMQKRMLLSSPHQCWPTPQRTAINQGDPQIEKQSRERSFSPLTNRGEKKKKKKITWVKSKHFSTLWTQGQECWALTRLVSEHLVRCRSISVFFKRLNYCWSNTHGAMGLQEDTSSIGWFSGMLRHQSFISIQMKSSKHLL